MAVIINASTSTGLVQSADTSGIIQFQSNGSTKATLSSSGFSYPGAVLQVVNATYSTEISNSTGTYSDAGLSASITPSSSSSKILILCSQGMFKSTTSAGIYMQVLRNSTSILINGRLGLTDSAGVGGYVVWNCNYLDSPATTSSITYKTQFRNYSGTGTAYVNIDGSTAQITLLEISG
jgi:hypothetical protein